MLYKAPTTLILLLGRAVDTVGGSGSQYVKGVLLHIDKYGNIIQLKSLEITDLKGEQTFFRDIHKTSEGDFIIGGYNDYPGSTGMRGILFRINNSGLIKWVTTYASLKYKFEYLFKNTISETKDGQVVTGTLIPFFDSSNTTIMKSSFYFLSVDKETGNKIWDNIFMPFVGYNTGLV